MVTHPHSPKISVIIPFKNGEPFLPRALECLELITFPSWEAILIDDGSTDAGRQVVQNWAKTTTVNVKLLHNSVSLGAGGARNAAVATANGEYVWFADCDDTWSPDVLTHLSGGITNDNIDMVVCDAQRVSTQSGKSNLILDAPVREVCSGRETLNRMLSGKVQGHLVNKLIKTALLRLNPFPSIRAHEDLAALLQLSAQAHSVAYVPGSQYTYLVREGSTLQSPTYNWRNLLEVSNIAGQLLTDGHGDMNSPALLRQFRQTHVMLPAAKSMAARGELKAGSIPYLSTLKLVDTISAIRQRNFARALQLFLLGISPQMYAGAYRLRARNTGS